MHFPDERLLGFRKAYKLFRAGFYTDPDATEPYLCKLHDAFRTDLEKGSHNCLGCNFADLTLAFDSVLAGIDQAFDVSAPSITFILWLYVFVERYDQVMNYLSVPEGYRKRHFASFQRIRRWANFIKHPKAFLFCHHPSFYHGGEVGDDAVDPNGITINDDFVRTYYAGTDKDQKLAKLLSNATTVEVVFPDPENLMQQFLDETREFVRLIQQNEVYREELSRITTAPNYFESLATQDPASQSPSAENEVRS